MPATPGSLALEFSPQVSVVDSSPLVFVEPIARGFRLEVLSSAITAVRERSNRQVFVVTREDFICRELADRIKPSWTDVNFVASSLDLGGASTGVLGGRAVEALLDAVERVLPCDAPADIVFLGADDYLGVLAAQLPGCSTRVRHARHFVFLYNSEDLVAAQLGGTEGANLGLDAIAAIESMDATLFSFNARLRQERIGLRRVKVLPDPWHGHFAPEQRKRAREACGLPADSVLITVDLELLLNERDPSPLGAAAGLAKLPFVHFALQGNPWALRSQPLRRLMAHLGDRLVYAGPAYDAERDIRMIAATDLLLSCGSAQRVSGEYETIALRTNVARRMRAAELGAAFDRDAQRFLLDGMNDLRALSGRSRSLIRGELDRLAQESLLRTFGIQLRAALRPER
jgi:hypothetical protein